jgi:predicted N-acetyltransferase YhbS
VNIQYKINEPVTRDAFIDVLYRSGLAERRPVDDLDCMQGAVENSNLFVTAWQSDKLIGVARSMTDFHYACYLSDLAVDKAVQGCGIGKRLQALTQEQLGPKCKLILIAAPAANSYYQHIGFENNPRCWLLQREENIVE